LEDGLLYKDEEETKKSIKTAKQNGVDLAELQELIKALWNDKD